MRTKTVTLYHFDELPSDRAKERARNWYRSSMDGSDNEFATECTRDEFVDVLKAAGFSLDMARGTRSRPAIYWNTNPVEAGFAAHWRAGRLDKAKCLALIADRPKDIKLHASLYVLLALATEYPDAYANVTGGRDGCTPTLDTWDTQTDATETDKDTKGYNGELFLETVSDLCMEFAKAIETDIDYANSNECIDEHMIANEYEFDEKGERA